MRRVDLYDPKSATFWVSAAVGIFVELRLYSRMWRSSTLVRGSGIYKLIILSTPIYLHHLHLPHPSLNSPFPARFLMMNKLVRVTEGPQEPHRGDTTCTLCTSDWNHSPPPFFLVVLFPSSSSIALSDITLLPISPHYESKCH